MSSDPQPNYSAAVNIQPKETKPTFSQYPVDNNAQYYNQPPQEYYRQQSAQYQYQYTPPPPQQGQYANYNPQGYQAPPPQQQQPVDKFQQYSQYNQYPPPTAHQYNYMQGNPNYSYPPSQYPNEGYAPPGAGGYGGYAQPYPTARRQRGLFADFIEGILGGMFGVAFMYPLVRARNILSIKFDTPPPDRFHRYRYGLPQILQERGMGYLFAGMLQYSYRIPAFTLDIFFFSLYKRIFYPADRYSPFDVPMPTNMLLGGLAALTRHMIFYPAQMAMIGVSETGDQSVKEFFKNVSNNLQAAYRVGGLKSLYAGVFKTLPAFLVVKSFQIGGTDSSLSRTKYSQGNTGYIKKFILAYGAIISGRYLAHPFKLAQERYETSPNIAKNISNYFKALTNVFKTDGLKCFVNAKYTAFRGSSSALAFAMYYHARDDVAVVNLH